MAKQFRCPVCGYVHVGDSAPDFCPVCKAPGDSFIALSDEAKQYAAEHVVGIAAGVDAEVLEGLRMNFTGECTEVGMYLAEAFKRYAFEEAEHASRFAELLGEVLTTSTKTNLELRAAAEFGACEGKTKLAKRAKELNLDAIHDTVHEMARDEARHGKGFDGLLQRYFQ